MTANTTKSLQLTVGQGQLSRLTIDDSNENSVEKLKLKMHELTGKMIDCKDDTEEFKDLFLQLEKTLQVLKRKTHVPRKVNHSKTFLNISLAISVVILAAFCLFFWPEEMRPEVLPDKIKNDVSKIDYPKMFENRTKEIQKLFPNQTKRFWSILKSHSLVHLRNKNPDQPLVILLGAPPSAHAVVNCLAKKLAWCLDPNVSPSNFIDGTKYSKDDGHNTKKILDDKLTDMFDRGARAALVMHLEQLPPPSPLLFYKYCDNDQAPYKHAGIIFTVYLRHEISASLSPVEAEGSIEKFLSNDAWGQSPYDRDSVLALLSRIADNVALVSHESDEVVQSVCHDVQ